MTCVGDIGILLLSTGFDCFHDLGFKKPPRWTLEYNHDAEPLGSSLSVQVLAIFFSLRSSQAVMSGLSLFYSLDIDPVGYVANAWVNLHASPQSQQLLASLSISRDQFISSFPQETICACQEEQTLLGQMWKEYAKIRFAIP